MKRVQLNLELTSVILVLAVGVLLPVLLSTATGIVALVIARDAGGIVTGVLVVSFAVTALGSALVTVMLAGRKARLARMQADFVAGISHEFRTPLSAIRLYAQTLQSGKLAEDPEEMERCLATILRETEWLDVVIEQVLTWRASSRDMLPLDLRAQPVTPALQDAAERFASMVAPGEVHLTCTLESGRPVLHDPRALQSVILNLLTNAYKYTGREKRIGLSARDEGGQVVIEVCDNGIGLSPAETKRVFKAFYRAHRPEGGGAGGTGLGLAIARYLVSGQGGEISVRSERGVGSTFLISFPEAVATP